MKKNLSNVILMLINEKKDRKREMIEYKISFFTCYLFYYFLYAH